MIVSLEGFEEEEETTPELKTLRSMIFELKSFEIIRDRRIIEDIFIKVLILGGFCLIEGLVIV